MNDFAGQAVNLLEAHNKCDASNIFKISYQDRTRNIMGSSLTKFDLKLDSKELVLD